ncbi:hypothetical protein AB0H57_05495 [Micromonospora sp. NPDC050686]|uniref:hypothetical protein n=1 Tax=Micromonospora sp. NPDC050686 TaxID=3154631 RepID=UPI0033E3344F
MSDHLMSMTMPEAPLFDLLVPERYSRAVRTAAQRRKVAYLNVALTGKRTYLVAAEELSGWGWETTRHVWADFMVALPGRLLQLEPVRHQWSKAWRLSEEPRKKKDEERSLLFRGHGRSVRELEEMVQEAGVDTTKTQATADADRLVKRLEQVFGHRRQSGSVARAGGRVEINF